MKSYLANRTILYLLLAWLAVPWLFPAKAAVASVEFQVLKALDQEGSNPYAGLTLDSEGDLYGTTLAGGTEGNGTVFKIDPGGNFSVLFNFSAGLIGRPRAGVVPVGDGSLYGTTSQFTGEYTATAYKIDASGNFILLHAFFGDFGGFIDTVGGLIKGIDGNFYGASHDQVPENRSGTIYTIDSDGNYSVIHEFPGQCGGPNSEPIQGSDGSFYGTTFSCSESSSGTVFKLDPSGNFSILHEFDISIVEPSKLLQTSDGSLYGAMLTGGANDAGIIYKIDPSGTFSVLHEFDGGNGGKWPAAGLIQGSNGNFYGTTREGGTDGQGIIYRISPAGEFDVLYSFDTITGANPYAPLVQYGDGSFYGTTVNGGSYGAGVVFRLVDTADATTTALTSSRNPSVVGQSVTFTATVSGNSPTGTVEFFVGSTSLGSRPLRNGVAALSTPRLVAGTHSITAVYSGDANNAPSTSAAVTQVVKAATGTKLTSSKNPSTFRTAVTFTASVKGSAPTGTVTFLDGSVSLGTATLGSDGKAKLTTAALRRGTHKITARYSGDANNAASTSSVLTQTVR